MTVQRWDVSVMLLPLEQRIFLSMLGPEAWRLHRETDVPVSLALSLFPVEDPFGEAFRGTHRQLRAMRDANLYGSPETLEARVQERLNAAANMIPDEFTLDVGMLQAVLDSVFQDTPNRMRGLNALASMMLASVDTDYPIAELAPHAAIWFDLCDLVVEANNG